MVVNEATSTIQKSPRGGGKTAISLAILSALSSNIA